MYLSWTEPYHTQKVHVRHVSNILQGATGLLSYKLIMYLNSSDQAQPSSDSD
jgi:hypothetical protein